MGLKIIPADLSDVNNYQLIADKIESTRLDCLIHCAAIVDPVQSILDMDLNQYEKLMKINVTACIGLTQACLKKLTSSRVLFISSGAAIQPISKYSAYCISKATLQMIKLLFQNECRNISFTDMDPGVVSTPMIDKIMRSDFDGVDFFKSLAENKRLIDPKVVAKFIVWLITEVNSQAYTSKTWNIYDTSHHHKWLTDGVVPAIN